MTLNPPRPPREPRTISQLGRTREDPYAWMKPENWRAVLRDPAALAPDLRGWLEAENAYAHDILAPAAPLADVLFDEMKGRIKSDDASVPAPDGPFLYWRDYAEGAQHPRRWRRPRDGGAPELLLDEEAQAAGKAYYDVGASAHSPDHARFIWAEDDQGSEYYRLKIKDIATGAVTDGPESSTGDFSISPCSRWLFWVWRDENARPAKVFRRPLAGGTDTLVYAETDEGLFLGVHVSSDERFILITSRNQETGETRLIDAATPEAEPVLAAAKTPGLRYDLDHWTDRWVIRTNRDGAVDFKLMTSGAAIPTPGTWTDFVAHRPGRLVAGFALFAAHLVRLEREDANDRIVVMNRAGGEHAIAFDDAVAALDIGENLEYAAAVVRIVHQTPASPKRWIDYDMTTGARSLRKEEEIPSGHDPADYEVRRILAPAADGAEVPMTLLMRKGTPTDGSAPVLLYGYGAYGIPLDATFSVSRLSLVDRGWIWADAHVRGGSDKGWGWFLDGRAEKKMKTFTDFIACAEALVAAGYTRPGRIVARGGSAGGMLMGVIANLRPDLFGGILAAVPFVDVLNTMSDADLPLTPPEWPEWGNPLEDPDAYDGIAAYSPYENVRPQAYPAILARAGLTDPRVTWWEPQKWTAALRRATTSDRPILLDINLEAGHGGASGRYDHLKEIALDYAFAIWALGEC
jgi:oligopeptidase B